jgi:hypothetical protein
MKNIAKIVFFVFSCLILYACPASQYTQYKLIGTGYNNDISAEYEKIILNKSDTIFVKVGILHQFINDKKTYLIVNFKESPNVDVNIVSTKYGILKSDNHYKNIYRREIKSLKKRDTLLLSYGTNRYYFTEK